MSYVTHNRKNKPMFYLKPLIIFKPQQKQSIYSVDGFFLLAWFGILLHNHSYL